VKDICDCHCHYYGLNKCVSNSKCCERPYKKYINNNGKLDRKNWNELREMEKLPRVWYLADVSRRLQLLQDIVVEIRVLKSN